MAYPVPHTWYVNGVFLETGAPFNQGLVRAFNKFSDGTETQIAETGLSAEGEYSLVFSVAAFQDGDPRIEFPTLKIRLYDYQANVIWESDWYIATDTPFSMATVDISAPQDEFWVVEGRVFYNSSAPLKVGTVIVYDLWNGERYLLAQTSVNTNGYFSAVYPKSSFLLRDPNRPYPDLEVVVRDAAGANVATYKVPAPVSVHQTLQIKLNTIPDIVQSDHCKVYGTIKNSLGYPLYQNITVEAFCLYYQVEINAPADPLVEEGFFVKIPLHSAPATVSAQGEYEITYSAAQIPDHLRLDANEAKGKDKASIYAEVSYQKPEAAEATRIASAPLIFNGQRYQKIDFVISNVASSQAKTEFEYLDEVLKIYLDTVINHSDSEKDTPHEKIAEFLSGVTRLPLVVGREDLDEVKVRAYFKAYQLYYEVSGIEISLCANKFAQYLYPLILNAKVHSISSLLALGLAASSKEIRFAIAKKIISARLSVTSFTTEIWDNLQQSKDIAAEQEDTFSAFHIFYLLLTGKLNLDNNGRPQMELLVQGSELHDKHSQLLTAYTAVGSDFRELIAQQKENLADFLTLAELEKLILLVDLGDFCDWYSDLVVCTFDHIQNSCQEVDNSIKKLEDILHYLVKKPTTHEHFWAQILNKTSLRYKAWDPSSPLSLPLNLFPGTSGSEQIEIAIRLLDTRLRSKFAQVELLLGLTKAFEPQNPLGGNSELKSHWLLLINKLKEAEWHDFDINSGDLEAFLKANPELVLTAEETSDIKALQRLYRLTDKPTAVAGLILNGFDSATSIAQVSGEHFIAEFGLNLGDKKLAENIHRLATNFVAEASLAIEKYHPNLNETGLEITSLPRSVLSQRSALSATPMSNTNVAKGRMELRTAANWKAIFGRINRNSGVQGQSILSPSAYLLDLIEFLKEGHAYNKFKTRRPDIEDLLMNKANAEVALPTIDMAVELLVSLAAPSVQQKVRPICNQTDKDATVSSLRAEPGPWKVSSPDPNTYPTGQECEDSALAAMMTRSYPLILPKNFYREEIAALLANLSLNYSVLSQKLRLDGCNSLPMDLLQQQLMENGNAESDESVWTLWGLSEQGNNLYFPDKSLRLSNKSWFAVLSYLAFVLDRSGLSYGELAEFLKSAICADLLVELNCDAESFQLADVNGYVFKFGNQGQGGNSSVSVPKEIATDFFTRLSVFVRRKNFFGWSVAEIIRTWEFTPAELEEIYHLRTQLGASLLEALSWTTPNSLTAAELFMEFPMNALFAAYSSSEPWSEEGAVEMQLQLSAAAEACGKLSVDDAFLVLQSHWVSASFDSIQNAFIQGLECIFCYSSWTSKNNLTVADYVFLKNIQFPVEPGSYQNCSVTLANLELLRNSSLSISDLQQLLAPFDAGITEEVASFTEKLRADVAESLSEFAVDLVPVDPEPEASAAEESIAEYENQILSLLKSLGAADGALFLPQLKVLWENPSNSEIDKNELSAWLEQVFTRYQQANKNAITTLLDQTNIADGLELFYHDLCRELVANQIVSALAEKFSVAIEVIAALLKQIIPAESENDFLSWINLIYPNVADEENPLEDPAQSVKMYCRVARAATLYQYVGTLDLGFAFDWNFYDTAEIEAFIGYDKISALVNAYAASSVILSKSYNYPDLYFISAESLKISPEVYDSLREYADIPQDSNPIEVYAHPDRWYHFAELLSLYKKTNCLPEHLQALLARDFSVTEILDAEGRFVDYRNQVDAFRTALKKTHTTSSWNKFIQGVSDKLRKSKRDALASFVCWESQQTNLGSKSYPQVFWSTSDIYSYYLFDVEMEPDMAISRTVQAVACIQLYVQRALLGLEGYSLSDSQKSEWEWMKNYQVWVANRKIFLYPENWVVGDLREDKSPFFEELEDRIAECGNNQKSLDEALGEYLDKVVSVSEIDVVGACKEDGGSEAGVLYTLHIIGRTRGAPHTYYYRKYMATALYGSSWTPWQALDFEIDGNIAQPAIFKGKLYVLWLQVIQGQRQKKEGEADPSANSEQSAVMQVEYYADIRLKWTSYNGKKWEGVKVGEKAVYDVSTNILDFTLGENETLAERYIVVDVSDNSDFLNLAVCRTYDDFTDKQVSYDTPVASAGEGVGITYILKKGISRTFSEEKNQNFAVIGVASLSAGDEDQATSYPCPYEAKSYVSRFAPIGSVLKNNYFVHPGGTFILADGTEVLSISRGSFKVLSTNMSFLVGYDQPFFYMDSRGTYLVTKVSADGGNNANSVGKYRFELMTNPNAKDYARKYQGGGSKWLYNRETQAQPVSDSYYYSYSYYNYYFSVYLGYYMAGDWQAWDLIQSLFEDTYHPNYATVAEPYPASTVDFCWGSSTSIYNWELFFYVPMLMADKMLALQDYESALKWIQLVFDPRLDFTGYEDTKRFVKELPAGSKFWHFLPFFANPDADKSILAELGQPTARDMLPDRKSIKLLIDKWKNDPFNPHLIARYRPAAYQKHVVMRYLDILIGWGDLLFTQDTTESVNLAIQMYVLAADLLGPKSAIVPDPSPHEGESVKDILRYGTGIMGEAYMSYEDTILSTSTREKQTPQRLLDGKTMQTARTMGKVFYFDIPRNDKLMAYWDTVADRLYKIRNSMNIEGVKRTLALFAPPIDPGMLVKARAAGVSISDCLADASSALPYYRFKVMLAKAFDIVRDVQKVGQELLVAIENNDAEALVQMKASHEQAVVTLSRTVQDLQVTELEKELETVETEKENLEQEEAEQNSFYTISDLENKYEELMGKVRQVQEVVEKIKKAASVSYKLPDFDAGGILNGLGGPSFDVTSLGGSKIGENLVSIAEGYASKFLQKQIDATKVKIQAEAERKLQEWTMKKTAKQNEAKTIEKKVVTAQIKIQQAQKENEHIEQEIARKAEMYDMLSEKFSSKELYTWMVTELGNIYKTMFRLAVKVARKAEKCYHFEIGDTELGKETQFIKGTGSYWNGLSSGLLAGEALLADLHAMEVAYLDNDRLEQEITVPVSLKEIDPIALRNLQVNGSCRFRVPEVYFDMRFPGHYFRRIRDVQLEIQNSVSLPPTSISANLTLESNKLYLERTSTTPVVIENRIGVQNKADSLAQAKGDVFNFNLKNDKYPAFEGSGVDSTWNLSLPVFQTFDYEGIKDVILHISYTARNGSDKGVDVVEEWKNYKREDEESATGLIAEFRLSEYFPAALEDLISQGNAVINISRSLFPYYVNRGKAFEGYLFAKGESSKDNPITIKINDGNEFVKDLPMGDRKWGAACDISSEISSDFTMQLTTALVSGEDILIQIRYELE